VDDFKPFTFDDVNKRILRCAECGERSTPQAEGWRATHGRESLDPDEQKEVLTFCPACWEREFEGA
jgi:hypothetical protein